MTNLKGLKGDEGHETVKNVDPPPLKITDRVRG